MDTRRSRFRFRDLTLALSTAILLPLFLCGVVAAAAPAASSLSRVLVLTTGGTISLSGQELVEAIPQLNGIAQIKVEEFVRLGSSSMTPGHWIGLSRRINEAFVSDPGLAGVIVTHGTDTMEETAYFLHLTVHDDRPVIVTGAMRGPSAVSADGPANMIAATRTTIAPEARGQGVLVVMNDWIHSARDVRKMDSNRVDAFRSEWGPLGLVDADRVLIRRRIMTRHTSGSEFRVPTELGEVPIVADYAGSDGSLIRELVERGVDGIVVQAFADGRASPGTMAAMREATEAGIPVALASRVPEGRVMDPQSRGLVIAVGDFSPHKARVLLMLALQISRDAGELNRIFSTY